MLSIAASISSNAVTVNNSNVASSLKSVPSFLWPDSCISLGATSGSGGSIDHDFLVIAEFCELEGPKPTIILPEEYSPLFDLDGYMLRIFSADTSGLQLTSTFGVGSIINRPDCESCIFDRVTGTHAYVHYVTLRDAYARGYVRPFAIVYLTPSEEKLQSQLEKICTVLRKAVGEMRRANVTLFTAQLNRRIKSMEQTDQKYEQIIALLREFDSSLNISINEDTEAAMSNSCETHSTAISSLWELCGQEMVDLIQDTFSKLLENLSASPSALSVTAIRKLANDSPVHSSNRFSLVFMNRLPLLPRLNCETPDTSNSTVDEKLHFVSSITASGTEFGLSRQISEYSDISIQTNINNRPNSRGDFGQMSEDSDSTMTFVESISPLSSPVGSIAVTSSVLTHDYRQSLGAHPVKPDNNNAIDVAALTLPYFLQSSWPRGLVADLLKENHKTIAQALTWLAAGLTLVIAGDDIDLAYDLASELASLSPTCSMYVNEEALSLRGITVVSTNSTVRSPVDLPTSSPSLWIDKDSGTTIVSAWGPPLTYSPFLRLLRRAARFNLPLPIIRLLLANQWTNLVQLAHIQQSQTISNLSLEQMLKRLGRYPADNSFIPAALTHLIWLASLS